MTVSQRPPKKHNLPLLIITYICSSQHKSQAAGLTSIKSCRSPELIAGLLYSCCRLCNRLHAAAGTAVHARIVGPCARWSGSVYAVDSCTYASSSRLARLSNCSPINATALCAAMFDTAARSDFASLMLFGEIADTSNKSAAEKLRWCVSREAVSAAVCACDGCHFGQQVAAGVASQQTHQFIMDLICFSSICGQNFYSPRRSQPCTSRCQPNVGRRRLPTINTLTERTATSSTAVPGVIEAQHTPLLLAASSFQPCC